MKVAGVVLAAGAGRRLAPLTDHVPKPLLPILDRSLLERQIRLVRRAGAERVYVNTYHHAAAVAEHLECHEPTAIHRLERRLTGPAGALLLFADELREYDAVLVASSDVLLGEDLVELLVAHLRERATFTFGVVETTGARRFGVLDLDSRGVVRGAREKPDVPDHESHPVSAGVYCLRPEAIERIGELARRAATVDFARDLVPSLLASGARVIGHRLRGYWRDVGTASAFLTANHDALEGLVPAVARRTTGQSAAAWAPPFHVHATAAIGADVKLTGPVVVGAGARIGNGAELAGAVVLPDAVVAPGALIVGGIVAPIPEAITVEQARELHEAGLR